MLAFFATRYEWYLPLKNQIMDCKTLNVAVGSGLVVSAFAVICVPFIERLVFRIKSEKRRLLIFWLLIEPLRYGSLFLSAYLIFGSLLQIPWLSTVFGRATSFIAVSVFFVGGLTAAIYWVRHIEKIKGSSMVFVLIGFGICFFYYLSLMSYVFGVYPTIPANRGGRMPVTEAYVETTGHDTLFATERKIGGVTLHGPIYILEETSDTIYFASEDMDKWFDEFVTVHALSSSSVPYMRFERINDGFPRVPRKHLISQ